MSRIFKILCFVLLVGCSLTQSRYLNLKESPHILIFDQYKLDFKSFQQKLAFLNKTIELGEIENKEEELRNQFAATRLAYKKIEFIFDYMEPNFAYLYVNGGPLPKLHKEVSEIDIIPPNGLQRLDEIIFSDDLLSHSLELETKVNELITAISFIDESHLLDTISQQNVFESLRSGMVRVFTLGLTGFDTPGSMNGMLESIESLKSMRNAFSIYRYDLDVNQRFIFNKILGFYQEGISQLESNPDFDSFDRMKFLKEVVNPLYGELFDFQIKRNIEVTSLNRHAQNYNTQNLFDESFLDRDYYSQFSYQRLNNKASIELGKTLFYDPILSKNLNLSCSSCHNPKLGFADGLPKSPTSQSGVFTKRNSPSLIDVAYSSKYFWDMREHDLEKQVAHVVDDSTEFNIGFKEITKRLNQSETYVQMFESAFGGISKSNINRRSISNAIAAYVNTLTSFNSPFDQYVRNENVDYSNSAKAGFNLFMGKAACGTCHFAPAFNGSVPPFYIDAESEVLGVTVGFDQKNPKLDPDIGRSQNGKIGDAHPHFDHSFKTITVRNSELTAPYMHNGSFNTLEDVIEFYDKGGGLGMGVEIENQTLSDDPLNLSAEEKIQLIDFLNSLTDTSGLIPEKILFPKFRNQPYWNNRGLPKVID